MNDMNLDTLLLTDPRMSDHDPGPGHPECPDRLQTLSAALTKTSPPGVRWVNAPPATASALGRVHTDAHVEQLLSLRGSQRRLDADTIVSPASVDAALLAAGAGLAAVDAVLDGNARNAMALVRPPGHHAEADRAMGFCLVNNVAIAAEHARKRGLERVLVVDWDVHHGNGTQHSFEDRRDVLFFSTHQFPFYPGTGAVHEVGRGAGEGFTVNVPLPAGCTDGDLLHAFESLLHPIADRFQPELVLVSAGFDAHRLDPLGDMSISGEGFASLCAVVRTIAQDHAQNRLVLLLEGGYDLQGLVEGTRSCLDILTGAVGPSAVAPTPEGERAIHTIRAQHAAHWSL